MASAGGEPGQGASIRDVLANRTYLPVFLANTVSVWGDYIARITVASVVFDRTGSALATAATFAVSLVPTIVGRGLLSAVSDRVPYRDVLVVGHALRAVLAVVLLVWVAQESSILGMFVLVFLLEIVGGPVIPASQMLLTDLFPDRRLFARAFELNALAEQVNQAIGLAAGGTVVFLLGPTPSLVLDALSFATAAVVVVLVVQRRPIVGTPTAGVGGYLADTLAGMRFLRHERVLGSLLGLSLVAALAMAAPEAVAIPYARSHTDGGLWAGLLMAAPIVGAVLGLLVIGRLRTERQIRAILPLAVLMPLPLLVTVLQPPLVVVGVAWVACGALQAFMLPLQSSFTVMVPDDLRGRVFGLAGSLAVATSGLAFLAAGWLSELTTPAAAVGICAVLSLAGLVLLAATWPGDALRLGVAKAYAVGGRRGAPTSQPGPVPPKAARPSDRARGTPGG